MQLLSSNMQLLKRTIFERFQYFLPCKKKQTMIKSLLSSSVTILSLTFLSYNTIHAQCTVVNTPASFNNTFNDGGPFDFVQSFTATCTGNMQYFQLTSSEAGTMPGSTLSVYNGNVSGGTAIYTQAFSSITTTGVGQLITINITGALPLVSGNQYSFRFFVDDLDFRFDPNNQYSGGNAWQNGSPLTTTDFYFTIGIGGCLSTGLTANNTQLPTLTDQCSVSVANAPTATTSCGTNVIGVPNVTFPITTPGTSQITWSYNDGNGNSISQTQAVVIADVTPPVADVAQLPDVTGECEVSSLTPPTATDNCAGTITGTTSTSFPIDAQGVFQVIWTFDDGNGNTITQTQNVIINDVTAPVPTVSQLPDLTNQCLVTTLTPPTATDNCGGTITGTTTTTAPIQTLGNSTITWTFDDGNGNTTTQTQNVINPTIDNTVTVTGATIQANEAGAVYQWLDCDNNLAPIAGETNQAFTATAITGNYAVEINVQGCVATSTCELIDFSGIEELTQNGKELVKIVDLMGRETKFVPNTPLIFIYSDGSMERVMEIE